MAWPITPDARTVKIQAVARTLLKRAADRLPRPTRKRPDHEGLAMLAVDRGELKKIAAENLAFLEECEQLGIDAEAPGGFWRDLERVAQVLGLGERALEFRHRFNQALSRKASGSVS